MKRFIVLLIIVVMCGVLSSCREPITSEEKIKVSATVTELEYEESYCRYNPALRILEYVPEEYLVTIKYKDISKTFDNKRLYESVKEGDSIRVILYKKYDEDGKLIKQTLQLPE